MKRRLRKKLHKGEFKELGFSVRFRLAQEIGDQGVDDFMDEYLTQAIGAHGLGFGGSGRYQWEGVVALIGRGSATEEHRMQVDRWLGENKHVQEHEIGELMDIWYDIE